MEKITRIKELRKKYTSVEARQIVEYVWDIVDPEEVKYRFENVYEVIKTLADATEYLWVTIHHRRG